MIGSTFFRYEDSLNDYGSPQLLEFVAIRETPQGVWLRPSNGPFAPVDRWMSLQADRLYAHKNRITALKAYASRKRWQVKILQGRLSRAKLLMSKAESLVKSGV